MHAQDTAKAYVEQIAKICSVRLCREDHGILTCLVDLDYGGGSCQGVGGYSLDEPREDAGRRGTAYGMEWIARLMGVTGVDDFGRVQGRTVIALRDEGYHGRVRGLKPLPTEQGEPFIFDELGREFGLLD